MKGWSGEQAGAACVVCCVSPARSAGCWGEATPPAVSAAGELGCRHGPTHAGSAINDTPHIPKRRGKSLAALHLSICCRHCQGHKALPDETDHVLPSSSPSKGNPPSPSSGRPSSLERHPIIAAGPQPTVPIER